MMPTNFEIIERASLGIRFAVAFLQKYIQCRDINFGLIVPASEPQFLIYLSVNEADKRIKARDLFGPDEWAKTPSILGTHFDYTKLVDGVTVVLKSAEPINKTAEKPETVSL
jgi:hypothetical protein